MRKLTREELKAENAMRLVQPMTHPGTVRQSPPDIITRGEGSFIWDVDGHRLVDGVGGLWCTNLGFGRREIRDAIVAQLDELPFYNTFRGATHPRAIELAQRVVRLMAADGVGAVHFSSGGSDAVEGALKLARQYWKVLGQRDRTKFISLRRGYHGVHFGGASVNGNTPFRRAYEPLLPGCFHVDTPWLYRNPYTQDPQELGRICAELLEREIVFQGPDTVAAFIAEPIQGAGGFITPPAEYFQIVEKIVRNHGGIFISDEVQTAWGRTGGKWFDIEHYGVIPDVITSAKGLGNGCPIGLTVATPEVAAGVTGLTISTFGGNPIATTAAKAVLDFIEQENLLANAAETGAYLRGKLEELRDKHPIIGDVRGMGLMQALELVEDRQSKAPAVRATAELMEAARRNGLLIGKGGTYGNCIRISPPLNISKSDVDECARLLDLSLMMVAC